MAHKKKAHKKENKKERLGRWYQEYKNCSCTEVAERKNQLLGYCRRHMNDPRRTVRFPEPGIPVGFCET